MVTASGGVAAGSIRVGTFNILAPTVADWSRRAPAVSSVLAGANCDVVALQEVSAGANREEAIRDLLGTGWHFAWHSSTAEGEVGLVLASRWPVVAAYEQVLDVTTRTTPFAWSAVVIARIQAPKPVGDFWVAHHKPVYHLDFERERELQAVTAAAFIDSVARPSDRVVLVGDFDAPPDSSSVRFWSGRQSLEGNSVSYHDAWAALRPDDAGCTFSPDNVLVARGPMSRGGENRIDYIMVRGDEMGPCMRVHRVERFGVTPYNEIQASDHYGVFADLKVTVDRNVSG